MRSSLRADRSIGWLLPVLAMLAEGALLAVIYVAVQTAVDHRPPLLGAFEFALAAGLAAFAVHRGWLDPDENPVAFLALLGGLGVVGWMWDADARALVLDGDLLTALSVHPGGWLAVVAGMRGVGRGAGIDDRAMTRLVLVGVPSLAAPWLLGQLGARELRDVFTEEAFVASLTFVTTGFMAAGLARLREIGRETGIDWRHDRSWLGTVFGVLVIVLVLSIPASIAFGLPGDAVARGILGPILSAFGYILLITFALAALVAAVLAGMLGQLGIDMPPPPERAEELFGGVRPYTLDELGPVITGFTAAWVAIAVVFVVLARLWLRRRTVRRTRTGYDERSFQVPPRSFRLAAPRLNRTPSATPVRPHDAVSAYVASLEELAARRPTAARAENETPRSHARRVAVGVELNALQADYALVRYGGRSLTDAEQRRALGRWRRLRDRLRGRPRDLH